MKRLYVAKYGYIIMSILFYIFGLVYMFLPEIPDLALCIAAGVCLLVYGAIKLVGYLSPDLYCLAFQYDMASAILLMVLGVLTLVCNVRLRNVLVPGLGVLLLCDSVLTIQTAKDAAKFGIRSWVLLLVVALICLAFGVIVIAAPISDMRLRHVIVGLSVLFEGLMKHCVVLCTVRGKRKV
ncbi:hypothetical protein B6K86_07285 [Lachnospiraceae bacterium]|nr:hypothetical protein B6K86_07285 [Lachnospiraceae bacterium]